MIWQVAGYSIGLFQRIAAGDAGVQAAQGHKAVHGADVGAIGLVVREDITDRVVPIGPGPPAPLFQGARWEDVSLVFIL